MFRWNITTPESFTVNTMHRALMYYEILVDNNNQIWKSKIPLKLKIAMWYLRRGVVLTKDNLFFQRQKKLKTTSLGATGKGRGSVGFVPMMVQSNNSSSNATLRVLLGQSFKLHQICTRSQVFANIYGHWLDGIPNSTLVRVGASALLWSLWLSRNDFCFFNGTHSSLLQVIFHALASYVVDVKPYGLPAVVQGSVYAIGAGGHKGFHSTWVVDCSFDIGILPVL